MYEETLEICKQVTTIVSEQQTDEYEEFIKKLKFLLDLGRSRLKQKVNVDGCNTIGGIYFA
jgi:predicted nucleic acid-binding protein